MNKYTPGPWHWTDTGQLYAENGWLGFGQTGDAYTANKLLIAAAPELAEALRMMFLGDHIHTCRATVSRDGMCAAGCKEAQAALKKAGVLP
jgi:hypothetical protein